MKTAPNDDEHQQWLVQVMQEHRCLTKDLKMRLWLHQQWPSTASALSVNTQRDFLEDATDLLLFSVPNSHCEAVYALRPADTSTF